MMMNFLKIFSISRNSQVPLYLQIFEAVQNGVRSGIIPSGQALPSINDLCTELDLSRNTVEKGYQQLVKSGMVVSKQGKGFYIKPEARSRKRILLLFNKISVHKKLVFDAFVRKINQVASVDLCVYNNDLQELRQVLTERRTAYNSFVLIPPCQATQEDIDSIISIIPPHEMFILNHKVDVRRLYKGSVYEDFEKDIFLAMVQLIEKLRKYKKISIIFPVLAPYPLGIINGLKKFCKVNNFTFERVDDIASTELSINTVYISLLEDDLMILLEKIPDSLLRVGKDIGLISYNDTPLKKHILNGLTTISADFQMMGNMMADLVMGDRSDQLTVPFYVTSRNSL